MASAIKIVKPLGGARLSPRMVVANVAFNATGDAAVTADELGLKTIKGFSGGVWGGTDNAVATIYSTTAFSVDGVSTVDLLCMVSDGGIDAPLQVTCSVLFWGE